MSQPAPVYSIQTNTGGISWGTTYTGPNVSNTTWTTNNNFDWGFKHNPNLKVEGDAEIEGDLKVKGKSIAESLDKIEQRLAIIHRNTELEEKWDELRELADKYRALEAEIIEKEKIWNLLNK